MPLVLRLALRELGGSVRSLRLLMACLILGVAAIAAVGSLSASILAGMASKGQSLLGGDIAVRLINRPATPIEYQLLARQGVVSTTTRTRAMVRNPKTGARLLGELKAVDSLFPLYGSVTSLPAQPIAKALQGRGCLIEQALADRLGVKVGDTLAVGEAILTVRGISVDEPDRASEGFTFGPSLLIDSASLAATQLVQPGSLVRYVYRIKTPPATNVKAAVAALHAAAPRAGWRIQDRRDGAAGVRNFVVQFGQFLTFVGLTTLMVSGLGVANAVSAWLERRVPTIATYKVLGASSGLIFRLYLTQVALVTGLAIVIGLLIGAALPIMGLELLKDRLPVPPTIGIYPAPLAMAALYGGLIALIATVWPLARARVTPPARLFRARAAGLDRQPPRAYLLLIGMAVLVLALLALGTAEEPLLAAGIVGGALGLMLILRLVAWGIALGARSLPRARSMLLRLAITNLHRPANVTAAVVTALGLGLSLLAALTAIEGNLKDQIQRVLPERAPAFFFLDINKADVPAFRALVDATPGARDLKLVPALRGPITDVKGVPAEQLVLKDKSMAWVLNGDRGLTYSATIPENNKLTAGRWWPENYQGPQLVSFEEDAGRALGLNIGDHIGVSVLGVPLDAQVANFRKVEWDSLGFNFVMVFSPGVLDKAPISYMATVAATPAAERALFRSSTDRFPTISVVRVREVLESVGTQLTQIAIAIRVTALLTIIAGLLVLIGAMAAGQQARIDDAVLLKILGATRGQILQASLLEYSILGLAAALLAVGGGTAAAWFVITQVFESPWHFAPLPLIATIIGGALLTIIMGLLGTHAALRVRPNRLLRA